MEQFLSELNFRVGHIDEVKEYLIHYEYGVAYENLCAIIRDEKYKISKENYEKIIEIGKELGMDSMLWEEIVNYVEF